MYKVLYFFGLELNAVERFIPTVDEQGTPINHIFMSDLTFARSS
jgi:hypothetical protein